MGTSKKISGPGYTGLKGADRVPSAGTNTMGGGVDLRKQKGAAVSNKPGAPTDSRDAGSHSIKAKDRRVSQAPTNYKGS